MSYSTRLNGIHGNYEFLSMFCNNSKKSRVFEYPLDDTRFL